MNPGTHVIYHGPGGGGVVHGEYCKILEPIPHGYTEPNGTVYIGDWMRVESMDEPGIVFAMPEKYFHRPKGRNEIRHGVPAP